MGLMSRALWHVNRSPLRYAVKSGVSAWHLGEKLERRGQAQLLNVTAAEKNKAEELNANGYAIVTELMDPAVQQQFAEAGMTRLGGIENAETKQSSNWKKFWVRLLDAEMAAQYEAENRPRDHDQRRHDEEIGNDVAARRHGAAQGMQHRAHDGAERSIDRLDDPEFVLELFH